MASVGQRAVTAPDLHILRGSYEARLHGHVLAELLQATGMDAEGLTTLLNRHLKDFGGHLPRVVKEWLEGGYVPDSPWPLLMALKALVVATGTGVLPDAVVQLLLDF